MTAPLDVKDGGATIPAEIMKEARAFCDANPPSEESIARLIMAERERAARIARERFTEATVHKTKKGEPYAAGRGAILAAGAIAYAILSEDTKP